MFLLIIFTILSFIFTISFFFGKKKFSLDKLLYAIWFLAIGLSQLRLSPLENKWPLRFWLILSFFFLLFYIFKVYFDRFWQKKITDSSENQIMSAKKFFWLILFMILASLGANIYIYLQFHTLPILSSIPDKMRFIINRDIFGLWEYLAQLPRIFIPMIVLFLAINQPKKTWVKILSIVSIILGFAILSLYASRLTIIIAILMSYFSYLILKIKQINLKRIFVSAVVVVGVVLAVSVIIPIFRQNINYRDYYKGDSADAYSYILDITKLQIPAEFKWLSPVYIASAFNLQVFMISTNYYQVDNYLFGRYNISVFDPALRAVGIHVAKFDLPWKQIFKPWWITATFLQSYWADYGYLGIILAGIFWSALLSGVYIWATKKPSVTSALIFGYLGFITVMTIYTNYFLRQELYMDLVLILLVGWWLGKNKL